MTPIAIPSSAIVLIPSSIIDAPTELLTDIFSRLPSQELVASACVSHQWNQELNNIEIYQQLFSRNFPEFNVNGIQNLKKAYLSQNQTYWNYREGIFSSYILGDHNGYGPDSLLFAGENLFSISVWAFNHQLKVWDVESKKCTQSLTLQLNLGSSIAVVDQKVFLGGIDRDNSIRVYDRKSEEWLPPLLGHTGAITCLGSTEIISGSGEKKIVVVSGSDDQTIRIWDLDTMKEIALLSGHSGTVRRCAFAKNKLFSGSTDKTIMAWDLISFKHLKTLFGHTDQINSLAIDKGVLFSASADRSVRLWDVDSLEFLNFFDDHMGRVCSLVIADDFLIYTVPPENTIRIRHKHTLKNLVTILDRANIYLTLAVKDGRIYSDATPLNTIKVWDFTANHNAVLEDIIKQFKYSKDIAEAMKRFSRLPDGMKNKIYGEQSEDSWQKSTTLHKVETIAKHLKKS